MPAITQHQSSQTTKLLLIGDSGSGKTGALASLAAAGYRLCIIDVDNGLDVLRNFLTDESSPYVKQAPKCAENVHFVTLTDTMRNVNGRLIPGKATVWQRAMQLLIHWKDEGEDLGKVLDWGPKDVLVIDSLSMLSTAALNFHLSMNGALGAVRTQNEGRRDIGVAQNLLRDLLQMLYDASIKCNVILTSHITFVTEMGNSPATDDGKGLPFAGYPSAIGRALSPHIPRYFNTVLHTGTVGMGPSAKRKIFTKSMGVVNTKNPAPMRVKPEYPLETGLADFFKDVRG